MDQRMGVVYLIGEADSTVAKIGKSRDAVDRCASLQIGSPVRLAVLTTVPGGRRLELGLHKHFEPQRVHGEWFDFGEEDRIEAFHAAVELIGPRLVEEESEEEEVDLETWQRRLRRISPDFDMSKSVGYDEFCRLAHIGMMRAAYLADESRIEI